MNARKFVDDFIGMWTRIEVYRFLGNDLRSSLYSEKFLVGYMCFWRRLTKNQATTRPENLWPAVLPKREKPFRRKRSKKGQTRNKSSIMHESREVSVSSEDGEKKETIENVRRKLEVLMEVAILCKKGTKKRSGLQETEAKSGNPTRFHRTKHLRMESSVPKGHDDHIAGKGFTSMTHHNFVRKIFIAPSDDNCGCGSSSG